MKLTTCIMAILIATSSDAQQFEKCVPGKKRTAAETCVVDGDTLWLDGVKIRLKGFDTPETQTSICGGVYEISLGHRAKERLIELLNANDWSIEYLGRDSTQERRRLATIRISGEDVGDILINERLARRWPKGKEWWCRY
jgi:endonuclease YncB( thermonuclease family)